MQPSEARARSREGVGIRYEVHGAGDGPAIVLVQGLGLSSRFWFDQPQRLLEAGHASRVIVLDNRGTGGSDRPRGPYRLGHMADDVAAVIDAADAGPAVVVGISMGGMVAQHVAMRHPDKVSGLVLLATTPGLPHAKLPSPATLGWLLSAPLQRKGGKGSRKYNRLLLPEKELDRAHVHMARWPEALAHDPLTLRTFLAQFFGVMTNWTGESLRGVRCPAVVVHGEEDILIPPENGRRLAALLSRSELMMLPDVAHAVPMLKPEIVGDAVGRLRSLA